MPLKITIEWIPTGEESQNPKLFQIDIEEENRAGNLSDDEDFGAFRVEATDQSNGSEVDILSFGIESVSRKNFIDTAIECLGVLHSSLPAGGKRVTILSERSKSERSRFRELFESDSSGPAEDEPVVLLQGGARKMDQTPIHLPVQPLIAKALTRSHQPEIDDILDVAQASPKVVDEPWLETGKTQSPIPWGWFATLAVILVGAVLWSLFQVNDADEQAEELQISRKSELVAEEQQEREAVNTIDQIEASIRKYFACRTVEELIPLVRHTERVAPLMRDYYKDKPLFIGTVDSIKILQPLLLDTQTNFWMVGAILSNGHRPLAMVEVLESGGARVDWESLVCYQPMNWNDYAQKRPQGSTMDFRVYVEADDFRSHEFADPKEWLSVRLTAMDSIEPLFGYVKRDSLEALKLRKVMRMNGMQKTSLILRLTIPEGIKSPRGVVIDKLVSPRWIYTTPPVPDP